MDAQIIIPLLNEFSRCFTKAGYQHFVVIILSRMSMIGLPHCVTELMRHSEVYKEKHWTSVYWFLRQGKYSCKALSQSLYELLSKGLNFGDTLIVAIDDTLVKKIGKAFFGLGYYLDPTDKNPGAHKRRVRGHCWVVLALLFEQGKQCFSFPLAALLFVPQKYCQKKWAFKTKIELAELLLQRFSWSGKKIILLVDNLYAKGKLAFDIANVVMVSRLRSNAALYELPKQPKKRPRGRPRLRGKKVKAHHLYRRRSKHQHLTVNIYGKTVSFKAFVDVLMPSRTLGSQPILVIIIPQRTKKKVKMNVFFSTDINMAPTRLLELYALRFKIEDLFDEIKTFGGFSDCRQRSFPAIKRHATFTLIAYSLLRLLSLTIDNPQQIEAMPWWKPSGIPSVTRLRRAFAKSISFSFSKTIKTDFYSDHKIAA